MKTKIVIACLLVILVFASCTPVPPTEVVLPTNTPPPPTLTPTPEPAPETPIRLGEYELLSPEDMRYDLDELFHRIETTHPNPYAKRSKAEIDQDRKNIYDELDQSMTMFDFYNKVAPLIVSLGDFHTQVILPSTIFGGSPSKEKFLPLEVQFTEERGFAAINFTGNPEIPLA